MSKRKREDENENVLDDLFMSSPIVLSPTSQAKKRPRLDTHYFHFEVYILPTQLPVPVTLHAQQHTAQHLVQFIVERTSTALSPIHTLALELHGTINGKVNQIKVLEEYELHVPLEQIINFDRTQPILVRYHREFKEAYKYVQPWEIEVPQTYMAQQRKLLTNPQLQDSASHYYKLDKYVVVDGEDWQCEYAYVPKFAPEQYELIFQVQPEQMNVEWIAQHIVGQPVYFARKKDLQVVFYGSVTTVELNGVMHVFYVQKTVEGMIMGSHTVHLEELAWIGPIRFNPKYIPKKSAPMQKADYSAYKHLSPMSATSCHNIGCPSPFQESKQYQMQSPNLAKILGTRPTFDLHFHGKFVVTSNRMVITDPSAEITNKTLILDDVKLGAFFGFTKYCLEWGRTAKLFAVHESYVREAITQRLQALEEMPWNAHDTAVIVHSSACCIFDHDAVGVLSVKDTELYQQSQQSNVRYVCGSFESLMSEDTQVTPKNWWIDKLYDELKNIGKEEAIIYEDHGIAASSGFGDGCYPAFEIRDESGLVIAVRVDFIGDTE